MATSAQAAQAQTYYDAAVEHVTVAEELYESGRFVLASYVAGLATECMLRAFRHRIDPEFDARHDIDRLYKLAKFADVVPSTSADKLGAALETVIRLWSNDHRFLGAEALRRRWLKQKMHVGVKGDFLKERTRQLVNAADTIVTMGAARWVHLSKN
jgi:hypothetical protein